MDKPKGCVDWFGPQRKDSKELHNLLNSTGQQVYKNKKPSAKSKKFNGQLSDVISSQSLIFD